MLYLIRYIQVIGINLSMGECYNNSEYHDYIHYYHMDNQEAHRGHCQHLFSI